MKLFHQIKLLYILILLKILGHDSNVLGEIIQIIQIFRINKQ